MSFCSCPNMNWPKGRLAHDSESATKPLPNHACRPEVRHMASLPRPAPATLPCLAPSCRIHLTKKG